MSNCEGDGPVCLDREIYESMKKNAKTPRVSQARGVHGGTKKPKK